MFASIAAASGAKEAGRYLETRFERSRFRAMGGADIAIDASTPANGALGGGLKLTLVGIDVYSTISEGLRAGRLGYDMWNTAFQTELNTEDDLRNLAAQIEDLGERFRGETFDLEMHTRIELLNFLINKGPWTIQFGGYSEGLGGARYITPRQIRLVDGGANDIYLDFGEATKILRAGARLDTGAFVNVGHAFPIADSFRLAIGGRTRVFHRISLPEHLASVDAQVRTLADVSYPTDVNMQKGWGVALDAYATMQFSEDLTGFRIAAYVEDAVKYINRADKDFFVPPRFGLGVAWTSNNGAFTFASDLEHIETLSPTWQSGISYTLGNESLGITPMFGFIMNHRTITGNDMDPAITAGLALDFGIVHIGTVMELQMATRTFNSGLSVAVGFQTLDSKRKKQSDARAQAVAPVEDVSPPVYRAAPAPARTPVAPAPAPVYRAAPVVVPPTTVYPDAQPQAVPPAAPPVPVYRDDMPPPVPVYRVTPTSVTPTTAPAEGESYTP